MANGYLDNASGRVIFAGRGLGDSYMTLYYKIGQNGKAAVGRHRLKCVNLPVRETLEEAQRDLDMEYNRRHKGKWATVKVDHEGHLVG